MSALLIAAEQREINGRVYAIRPLSLAESRKVFSVLGKYLAAYRDGESFEDGLGATLSLHSSGIISEDSMDKLVAVLGKTSTVDLGGDRVVSLDTEERRSGAFMGRFSDMYLWIDECMRISFADVIAKMSGALKRAQERATPSQGNPDSE